MGYLMQISKILNVTVLLILFSVVTVSMAASTPSPGNGAVDVPADTVLSWTAGTGVVHYYKVYFGTDSTPDYIGNQEETTYQPSNLLDYNTTYYWQVDEMTDSGPVTGTVWSFTTGSPGCGGCVSGPVG